MSLVYYYVVFISIILLAMGSYVNGDGPPSPGYYPTSRIGSIGFNQGFANLWGPQHQKLDNGTLTIWLDTTTGSGFKSLVPYSSGYFGTSVKLQSGYTAGVISSFYLSNNQENPGSHDEIDVEFLGTTLDKPYVVQTNVYIKGNGDGDVKVGREMQFHLWFDPTKDFHNYGILWNPNEIIFLVDDVPIRKYPKTNDTTFPARPMWVYGSIWDASSWATENGKYKANYSYEPFVANYSNFKIAKIGGVAPAGSTGLSRQQSAAMEWVQNNYKVYDYCIDPQRDHKFTPEC
ncbi:probable xyloglucan endotransglucosylase/hydrolase protein 32 [Andrographis paniculata]|uniref:probable xyloglucan endotransglucosylase/hydrolase protein 32 n=1 Tax=Andrographis paniculata TaxID=175694 RepID=UPI0021E95641|nr:probable xyloglucan endotransglucosylase/hydrolase protein 32 [Andrographis paniculata]